MEPLHEIIGKKGISFGSKKVYEDQYPANVFVPKARILINSYEVWHGDLDLTDSLWYLRNYAIATKSVLVVFYANDWKDATVSPDLSKFLVMMDEYGIKWRKSFKKILKKPITKPTFKNDPYYTSRRVL